MGNARAWFYRILVVASTAFMAVTWLMPWWRCEIKDISSWVQIRPWGLEDNLGANSFYVIGSSMPDFFAPLMWIYFGLCIAALLFSLFARNKEIKIWKIKTTLSSFIIGFVGCSYIVVVITAVIMAAVRTGDFYGTHLIGKTHIDLGEPMVTDVYANLLRGYWLACCVGPLLVILALLRNKIIGRS